MKRRRESGFTLVEMLAVVTLVAMLIAIMLPSMSRSIRRAMSTVCMHNLHSIDVALHTYRLDHRGELPDVLDDAVAAEGDPHGAAWYGRLISSYLPDASVLICPADPFGQTVDTVVPLFRQPDPANLSSYGMNEVFRLSGRTNLERFGPKRPNETMLLADMGPDAAPTARRNLMGAASLYRTAGRLSWDDNFHVGTAGLKKSWLTERHLGRINILTAGGSVKVIPTHEMMQEHIRSFYGACASGGCPFCVDLDIPHYSFASSRVYWWTGSLAPPSE